MCVADPFSCPRIQVIHDATKDGRFASHPYVKGEPYIRFYAGAPLVASNGHRLGTMCGNVTSALRCRLELFQTLATFVEQGPASRNVAGWQLDSLLCEHWAGILLGAY